MHCASSGEFEQGKPLIEFWKKRFPDHKILVSFYSPSGYHSGKKYAEADFICYLPEDKQANAAEFMQIIRPSMAVFVKYDFWYYHLQAAAKLEVPLLLISAIFREQQPFFKWYGGLHQKMLTFFTRIFVQDHPSKALLAAIGIHQVTVAGDTRFDRVADIAAVAREFPLIKEFANGEPVLVAGSTWSDDEMLFAGYSRHHCKLVIAPHEIHEKQIEKLLSMFPGALCYSQAEYPTVTKARVLIIDNYGMLSSLYRYATVAYIGGGFNKSGIHNTLEAAVWGCPVIFGPEYQKFREARELVERGAAYSIANSEELGSLLDELLPDKSKLKKAGKEAADYVSENTGAVENITGFIQENRLLTS